MLHAFFSLADTLLLSDSAIVQSLLNLCHLSLSLLTLTPPLINILLGSLL
jgi:hypothetical protein